MVARIVVGVSGTERDRAAMQWAADRAASTGAPLEVVHVVDDDWGTVDPALTAEAVRAAEERVHDLADRIRAERQMASVHAVVLVGSPVYALCDHATGADLLVVGSVAREGAAVDNLRAARMAQYSTCSVAIIPGLGEAPAYGVVVGVDGSALSLAAVRFAAAEADRLGEPLTAVRAWQPPWFWGAESGRWPLTPSPEDEVALAESLAGIAEDYPDLMVERSMPAARPADALIAAAAGARMLVVGSHGRGAVGRASFGSVSEELTLTMPCAVAVIR
ncbi:MAG: universal stress protein [Solirubrobacteraceae bacterium]